MTAKVFPAASCARQTPYKTLSGLLMNLSPPLRPPQFAGGFIPQLAAEQGQRMIAQRTGQTSTNCPLPSLLIPAAAVYPCHSGKTAAG